MIYTFENFEFNTQLYLLEHDGQAVTLRPKIYQLLLYLIENRDRVISKQELSENVWPNQFISNAAMESAIRLLRRALDDNGRDQRILQTVFGHGYHFIAPVSERTEDKTAPAPPPAQPEPPETGWTCPTCQYINAFGTGIGNRFCIECGTLFRALCPKCGEDNPAHAKFCAACGTPLSSASTPEPPPPARPLQPEAERRQLTVMSCDLVDAITLPNRLELEDLSEVIQTYQDLCMDIIQRFEGHIAQYLGTTLSVYFGYPQAHEDDAQRAIRAGLDIIAAVQTLNTRLKPEKGLTLDVRIGIHTGPVIVGSIGGREHQHGQALGDPPNVALQIQRLAAANTLVASTATARLTEGYFVYQELGSHILEGLSKPIDLTCVLNTSGRQSRLDAARPGNLSPFVNRVAEISLLRQRWEQVQENMGQVILLSGEAGIGKSRLIQTLTTHLREESYFFLECRCLPYHQQSAFYPVIDLLQDLMQWQPEASPGTQLAQLETGLAQYGLPTDEIVPFFGPLLSIPLPVDRYPLAQLTPQQHRQKTLEAAVAVIMSLAAQKPVLFVMEDLHWVDPSTLELLTLLIDQAPTMRLGIFLTFRPTFEVPWGNRSYLTHIALARMPSQYTEEIVAGMTKGKPLPAELIQQVVDKTDGVPLFVEECTKTVLESGLLHETAEQYELTAPLPHLAIPATLHDSLMARLDRLASAKNIAQIGAVLGRQFSFDLLLAIGDQDETSLRRELDQLMKAELVHQYGMPSQATYVFKHALIQETAYRSLLPRTQQRYHERIAYVLTKEFPETVDRQPELVAYHYTEADLPDEAIPYWQRAGECAVERSAHVEAISHFTKGLELLKTLPQTPERIQQELTLQLAIGSPLAMTKGYAAPEVEQAYTRAQELCYQAGNDPQIFSLMVGLWRFYFNQAKHGTALELANQCFTLAQREQDPIFLQEAHQMLGSTLFIRGDYTSGRAHLEQGIDFYDPEQNRSLALIRGTDPGVIILSRLAWALWMLGYPSQALTRTQEAIALAQNSSHVYSMGFALQHAAVIHQFRRESTLVKERAEAIIHLAHEQGFVQWLAGGMCMRGWALIEQGIIEEGIAQLRQGIADWQSMGTNLGRTHMLARLAEAYGKGGKAAIGLCFLDESLTETEESEERHYEPEIYRLKGELILQQAHEKDTEHSETAKLAFQTQNHYEAIATNPSLAIEVETYFFRALDIARHRQAKSLELRAAMSLSRLWQQQGKVPAACEILAEVYDWFTEGFETPDLQEAAALLRGCS